MLFFPAFNLPEYVRTAVDDVFGGMDKVPEEGVGLKTLGIDLGDINYTFSKRYIKDAYGIDAYGLIGNYKGPGQGHTFDQTGISQATVILQNCFPKVL